MKLYDDDIKKNLATTDTIKKLQVELEKLKKEQVQLKEQKLYNAKQNKVDKKILNPERFNGNIGNTLSELYKLYEEQISSSKISTVEEFEKIIKIGYTLYTRLINYSNENDANINKEDSSKLEKFSNDLKIYNEIKKNFLKYNEEKKSFLTKKDLERFEIEKQQLESELVEYEKKIDNFSYILLTQIFKDYEEFKDFLYKDENEKDGTKINKAKTLETLAKLNDLYELFEKVNSENDFSYTKNNSRTLTKLEYYLSEVQKIDFDTNHESYTTLHEDLKTIIENLSENNLETNGDIVYVLLHFVWSNILINNNIMKYGIISEEYSERNNELLNQLRTIRDNFLNYYKDGNLHYLSEIPITLEDLEKDAKEIEKEEETSFKKKKKVRMNNDFFGKTKDFLFYDLFKLNDFKLEQKKEIEKFKNKNKEEKVTKEGIYEKEKFESKLKLPEFSHFENLTSEKEPINYSEILLKHGKLVKINSEAKDKNKEFALILSFDELYQIFNALEAVEVLKKNGGYRNVLPFIKDKNIYKDNFLDIKTNFEMEENIKSQSVQENFDEIVNLFEKSENENKIILSNELKMGIFGLFEHFEMEEHEFLKEVLSRKENFLYIVKGFIEGEATRTEVLNYLSNLKYKFDEIINFFEERGEIFEISDIIYELENNFEELNKKFDTSKLGDLIQQDKKTYESLRNNLIEEFFIERKKESEKSVEEFDVLFEKLDEQPKNEEN